MPQFVAEAVNALKSLQGQSPSSLKSSDPILMTASVAWQKLFRLYGTHYITQLTTGGKVRVV